MVEGARLESEYTSKAYRGFESLPLRHPTFPRCPLPSHEPRSFIGFSRALVSHRSIVSPSRLLEVLWGYAEYILGYLVLTELRCRQAEAADKSYKLSDARGLHMFVTTTGFRSWR